MLIDILSQKTKFVQKNEYRSKLKYACHMKYSADESGKLS